MRAAAARLSWIAVWVLPAVTNAQDFVDSGFALPQVGHSAADWGDVDRDGDLDLVLCGFGSSSELTVILRNEETAFVDAGAGLLPVSGGSARWGDYDRDGDLDLLLMGVAQAPIVDTRIYRNDGGAFTDIGADLEHVFQCDAAWVDVDADGDLDVSLGGASLEVGGDVFRVYRNEGGDTFSETPVALHPFHRGSLDWADYDLDGDPDVVITGLSGGFIPRSELYRNDGNGAFTIVDAGLFDTYDGAARWGDYDADGDPDIVLTGTGESFLEIVTHVYRNDLGSFVELGQGLDGAGEGSSVAWGDADGDGDLDFAATAVFFGGTALFRNDAGSFIEGGSELRDVCCGTVGWGDYDGDADLDLLVSGLPDATKLYRNAAASPNAPPSAPSSLGAAVNGNDVELSWSPASDEETPAAGLTYNVRVGHVPGGIDVVSPMALSSGERLVAASGNIGSPLAWVLHDLDPGTYFWSVQAIDNAFAGSPFAPEGTFTVEGTVSTPSTGSAERPWLGQLMPQPVRSFAAVTFEVRVPVASAIRLEVFDARGRRVALVHDGLLAAGRHELSWPAAAAPAPGTYFVRLEAPGRQESRTIRIVP